MTKRALLSALLFFVNIIRLRLLIAGNSRIPGIEISRVRSDVRIRKRFTKLAKLVFRSAFATILLNEVDKTVFRVAK